MSAQVQDHIKTVQLIEWETNSGQDADIQRFASDTLPTVLAHLRMAEELLMELRVQAAR
jgi:putative membrane protein